MRTSSIVLCIALFLQGPRLATQASGETKSLRPLTAPTYYIAAEVRECYTDKIILRGTSNLPEGSLIDIKVSDFDGSGWKDYSPAVSAHLDKSGYFSAEVTPSPKLTFRNNLVATVFFSPGYDKQPATVLSVVGRHGENLGEPTNPQAGHMSGGYSYLLTIARAAACHGPWAVASGHSAK